MKKYKNKEQRKKLFEALCSHIEQGYSEESFPEIGPDEFSLLMNKYKREFPADVLEVSRRKRRLFWEKRGMGEESKAINATIWIFNMKSRFGWTDRNTASMNNELRTIEILESGSEADND